MLDRRDVLRLAGGAGLTAACVSLLACGDSSETNPVVLTEVDHDADEPLTTAEAIAVIGRRYLASDTDAVDASTLRSLVGLGDDATPDVVELAARFGGAVRDDFVAGRTLRLDGWVLSLTEARLAAIVALEHR